MTFDGLHEWSAEEYAEKERAVSSAPRPLVSVLRTAADEYELVDAGASDLANTSFETSALNQILAWLNFPYQQRPYLDSLIGLAGSSETDEFTATNIEIARQVRTGRNANDSSMATWVTRQKKKLQLWQSVKQFNLVEITDGAFDARRRKNTPTTYKINVVYWAKLAVQKAKAKDYWRNSPKYRRNQTRAIRRACYEVLQSMENAPPLRLKIRTLSEEEKLDRRVHLQIGAHEKNLDFVHKMNMSEIELHTYVMREMQKAFEKKRGLEGNLITPPDQEPDKKASVFHKLKMGTLLDDINVENVETESAPAARHWADGEWVENSNTMPEKPESTEISRTDIESDNSISEVVDACKSFDPLTHGQTFSTVNEKDNSLQNPRAVVTGWFQKIVEKVPNAPPSKLQDGVWQFYVYDAYSDEQKNTESVLRQMILLVADGTAKLADLKSAFVDHALTRVEFWQNKQRCEVSQSKLDAMRTRLDEFIQISEGADDG